MVWTAPKTWLLNDPGLAVDMDTYVRDDVAFLYGDAMPSLFYGGPPPPPGQVGQYSATGTSPYGPTGAERHGNIVTLSGTFLCTTSSAATGDQLARAPRPMYYPAHDHILVGTQNTGPVTVIVTPTGLVLLQALASAGDTISVNASYSVVA